MDAQFATVPFTEAEGEIRSHLAALPSAIDSFLEDHIIPAQHLRIAVSGESAGFASIHEEKLITQFALAAPYRRHGQRIYSQLRRLEQVQSAYVPTCDEFFLAHALDEYRQVAKQAYFFATTPEIPQPPLPANLTLRPATPTDAALIRQESGDFFGDIDRLITAGELYVTSRDTTPVGFGIMDKSNLYDAVASIGMFTLAHARRDGVGTATIALLIAECRRQNLRPVAGCWYYNHRSKRTLERAGMFTATRLLKIDY